MIHYIFLFAAGLLFTTERPYSTPLTSAVLTQLSTILHGASTSPISSTPPPETATQGTRKGIFCDHVGVGSVSINKSTPIIVFRVHK